jgi:zinc transport system permease protein
LILDDFLIRAGLAGIGLAAAAGPLGCFVVWRRMAYFSDATAHAALLGVALALAFSFPTYLGVLIAATAIATSTMLSINKATATDTILGVVAHSALALGLVAVSLTAATRLDLMAFLFGDILAVGIQDLIFIWIGAVVVSGLMIWRWRALLAITINADLAFASGINAKREQAILTFALAMTVAISIKIVGALLIGAMLIIPAASARGLVKSPAMMAFAAIAIGSCSTISGLGASYLWDTPTGPTIVAMAAVFFMLSKFNPRA